MRRPPLSTWMAHGPTPERRAKGGSDTPARALALPSNYLGPAPQAPSALPSCLGQALGIAQPLSWPGAPAPSARQPRRRSQWSRAADAVEAYTRWLRCFILAALPQPLVARGQRWEQAINLSKEMWRSRLEPNVIGYNAAISACERPAVGAGHKLAEGNVALLVRARRDRLAHWLGLHMVSAVRRAQAAPRTQVGGRRCFHGSINWNYGPAKCFVQAVE